MVEQNQWFLQTKVPANTSYIRQSFQKSHNLIDLRASSAEKRIETSSGPQLKVKLNRLDFSDNEYANFRPFGDLRRRKHNIRPTFAKNHIQIDFQVSFAKNQSEDFRTVTKT